MAFIGLGLDRIFPLGDPPDYEPAPDESIAALAERAGRDPADLLYDLLLEHDGRELLLRPLLGYSHFTQDPIREMVLHPASALGLGDGGAHVRRDLRREHRDLHAHALGARPHAAASGSRSSWWCAR